MSNSVRAMNKNMGASADAETGSRPAGQAELHRLDASRFDPARLNELAERCEKATGPDRELDALIHALVELAEFADSADPERCLRVVQDEAINGPFYDGSPIAAYTASLDAVMTLVDDDVFFHISRFSPDSGSRGQAHVYPNRGLGDDYEAEAATPALALCAAALRALASVDGRRMAETGTGSGRSPTSAVPLAADAQTPPPSSNEGKLS